MAKFKSPNAKDFYIGSNYQHTSISSFTEHVGLLMTRRDAHLVFNEVPAAPVYSLINYMVETGSASKLEKELKVQSEKARGAALLGDLANAHFSAKDCVETLRFLDHLCSPITIYDSTMLPFLHKHLFSTLLPLNLIEIHSRQITKDSLAFGSVFTPVDTQLDDVWKVLGRYSFVAWLYRHRYYLKALMATHEFGSNDVFGNATRTLLIDIVNIMVDHTGAARSEGNPAESFDWEEDKFSDVRFSITFHVKTLVRNLTQELRQQMKDEDVDSSALTGDGYTIVLANLRRSDRVLDYLYFDGANEDTLNVAMSTSPYRFNITGDKSVPLMYAVQTIGAVTGSGKTLVTEAIAYWNSHETFGHDASFIYISEPYKPSLLGLAGAERAIVKALMQEDAKIIVLDSLSDLIVQLTAGQPLTSGGVTYAIRDFIMVLNALAAVREKVLIIPFNVSEKQEEVYQFLFGGVASIFYTPDTGSTLHPNWNAVYRDKDARRIPFVLRAESIFHASEAWRDMMEPDRVKGDPDATVEPAYNTEGSLIHPGNWGNILVNRENKN